MGFTLETVVPWGRSYDEYVSMFALFDADLGRSILGCGDGPASFNAVLTRRGGHVISVDPIYRFSGDEIRQRIDETYEIVLNQTRQNRSEFVWERIRDVDELGRIRMDAMNRFLADYTNGEGRYVAGELPDVCFEDKAFDLALCSHLLFLYSDHLSVDFHMRSIGELSRVAHEVRVFPLLELGAKRSRHLAEVIDRLCHQGYTCHVERVPYEFQKGGNEMLRVVSKPEASTS